MSPMIYGAGAAAIGGILLGWTVRDWKSDADLLDAQNKAAEQRVETEERWATQSGRYLDQIFFLSERSNTSRETIRTEFRDVEIPIECAAPVSVVGVLDSAVRDANAAIAGELVAPLPAATATTTPVD